MLKLRTYKQHNSIAEIHIRKINNLHKIKSYMMDIKTLPNSQNIRQQRNEYEFYIQFYVTRIIGK